MNNHLQTLMFEVTTSTIAFQFVPENSTTEGEYAAKVPPYYDKLNSWVMMSINTIFI